MINRQLKKRFCDVNDLLMTQVINLSGDDLEDLDQALSDFSEMADFLPWLEQKN